MSWKLYVWRRSHQFVKTCTTLPMHISGLRAVLLSCAMAVTACSKKEEKKGAAAVAPPIKTIPVVNSAAPAAVEKKTLVVVSPGRLPVNPRVPRSAPSADAASGRKGPLVQPAPPAKSPASAAQPDAELPPQPQPANLVHTPEQGNQARLTALQEMFRQRGQKKQSSGSGGSSARSSEGKSATTKTQP
ncbi:hypothetical protein [Prosthecobacter sp.]|uniref:hypothetical protein n=1 Tax=Prosthecobacter sp. TaxID=1965333 RepID=UPI0037840A31